MKKIKNIIKAYWYIDAQAGYHILCIIMFLMILISLIANCIMNNLVINESIKSNHPIIFVPFFSQVNYLCFFSAFLGLTFMKEFPQVNKKYTFSFKRLLMQLPINKKEILITKYLIISFNFIFPIIYALNLIIINLKTGSTSYISAYTGFFVAILCIWLIIIYLYIGFNNSIKNKLLENILFAFMLLSNALPLVCIIFGDINPTKISFDYFGKSLAPIIKSLSFMSSITGLKIIAAIIISGGFFCIKYPLRGEE